MPDAFFLCYATPAEHLRLPTLEDVKEGIIAAKIAAHAADIAKGIRGSRDWDNQMGKARVDLDWNRMFELAIDPKKREDTGKNLYRHTRIRVRCAGRCAQ